MTTGQRISEKRKELGLSQEALGEKLGVSRQSIYKWESDTSLPDVDKLIALSRLFGVSVGWLLGVEEASPPPPSLTDAEDWSARQEQIIEDVLKRYQQTQPKAKKTGREWMVRFLGFSCAVLLVSIFTLNSQLD
ncbi:MAG: helix-turn-helix transcriptional regulator, partial [Clostridium sp.]|nr:helix-turn-helix transcriptional regulator [Clostridium sp.]